MDINDITYKINGAIFEVNKILVPAFSRRFTKTLYYLSSKTGVLRPTNRFQ